jgi:hypothetical protein
MPEDTRNHLAFARDLESAFNNAIRMVYVLCPLHRCHYMFSRPITDVTVKFVANNRLLRLTITIWD